ncbi:hypothetical protein EG68_03532 [Paragonimus skrjabini miyazakii]|uniref:Magnesium-dependent phosphatase 1 n=1 Tax=Paragonimus skrjabini miyazakii TaxID=59628 RepID=A0A8S9Z4R2_9TREM|nr:hypothetical protein EG68_03532 [Paragonimus skrjabini miyazakii]
MELLAGHEQHATIVSEAQTLWPTDNFLKSTIYQLLCRTCAHTTFIFCFLTVPLYLISLAKKTGVSFNEMLFFDDLHWNIDEVGRLGVHAHLVKNGINTGLVRRALQAYEQAHKSRNTGV